MTTVETLLGIIDDPNLFTRRKIEAAEAIIGFEAPDDAVERARAFLVSVFEDRDADIGERMDALKITRKSEAAKITPKIIRLEMKDRGERERREAWREYEIDQLKIKVFKALPVGSIFPSGWCSHLTADDYVPPEGWPPWYNADGSPRQRPPPGDEWPVWSNKAPHNKDGSSR
jgi:hypothetical protein